MIDELSQLKQLVLSGGFDTESQKHVQDLESRLHAIGVKEAFAQNPITKPFIDHLKAEIERSELLLKTDKKLTDRERDALFVRIELAERFTSVFGINERAPIEEEIKRLLHVANTN